MAEPESNAASGAMHWDTLGTGADLWATVVMAAGFVLPAGQEVREHYRIVQPLGQGGMGQVLGVVLLGSADLQTYALKMVARPSKGDGEAKPMDAADRRDAEAQAKAFAALLRGEAAKQELVQRHGVSVARLFALVRFEDGALGLRMEIARGRSLEALIADEARTGVSEPPDVDSSLVVMRKLLYQLRRLHELVDPSSPSGFVHSDIKPGNVFVDDGDRYDPYVTLLDFGVSTAGAALDHGRATFSAGRKTLILNDAGGTFGFAPPHHFTGKPTPLSDVFAALVILFELITLQSPWDLGGLAKTPGNLFKLEAAMRNGARPVRSVRDSISVDVAAVLDRFFADEFAALHELADAAHEARTGADLQARRVMSDRLRTLAKSYQTKIEALRVLVRGGAPLSDPGLRLSAAEISASPLAASPPKPPPVPPRRSAFAADAAHEDVVEATRLDSSYIAGTDDPVQIPITPLIGWKLLLFIGLLAAGGGYVWFNGVPPEVQRVARTVAAWTRENLPTGEPTSAAVPDAAVAHLDASTSHAIVPIAIDVPTATEPDIAPIGAFDSGAGFIADAIESDVASGLVLDDTVRSDAGAHTPPATDPSLAMQPAHVGNATSLRVVRPGQPARPMAHAPARRPRAAAHAPPSRRRPVANAHRRPATHPAHRGAPTRSRSPYGTRNRR